MHNQRIVGTIETVGEVTTEFATNNEIGIYEYVKIEVLNVLDTIKISDVWKELSPAN